MICQVFPTRFDAPIIFDGRVGDRLRPEGDAALGGAGWAGMRPARTAEHRQVHELAAGSIPGRDSFHVL
jgi:hypothetical protein